MQVRIFEVKDKSEIFLRLPWQTYLEVKYFSSVFANFGLRQKQEFPCADMALIPNKGRPAEEQIWRGQYP